MFVSTMKITLGHKQVPRVWFAKFHSTILQAGSVKSQYDHTLRIKKTAAEITFLPIYVNDILISKNGSNGIGQLKGFISFFSNERSFQLT